MPFTMNFCATIERTMTGKLKMSAPAHIGPKSILYADKNSDSPTVNVFALVLVKSKDSRNSFHDRNKVNTNAVASPGVQIGRMI